MQRFKTSSQKNPSKTPPNNNKVPTFNNNCKRLDQNKRPNKPENKFKEPANATKRMAVAKRYVPNKALKKKNGYCLDTKSPATNKQSRDTKAPVQKSFRSLSQRSKGRRKKQ